MNEGGSERTDQGHVSTSEALVNNVLGTLWALTSRDALIVTIRSNSKKCQLRNYASPSVYFVNDCLQIVFANAHIHVMIVNVRRHGMSVSVRLQMRYL